MALFKLVRRIVALTLAGSLSLLPLAAQNPSPASAMPPPDPQRAQKALERGTKAEAEGKLDEWLAAYDEAARYAPGNPAILARDMELRSKLVRNRVEAAERDALESNLREAKSELSAALRIDPGNGIVAERLRQMERMGADEPPQKNEERMAEPPQLRPQEGKRNFSLRGDTKSAYEEIARTFGVKVSFDPDLAPRPVRMRLEDVNFFTVVSILGLQTGTFWRPINPGLFFVAADTADKRRQYGLQAERVFVLPASVAPDEMTELLRILREITGATHIELDTKSRSISIRDSPQTLNLAGKIIDQIERARGEVMVEAEILEVDKNKSRDLGVTPPSSTTLYALTPNDVRTFQSATDAANLLADVLAFFQSKGLTSIPPVALVGGGKSSFLLTLPSASASFSDALSLVRSGRQVLLRAQNGKPATFFVGDRYPVTLALLSSGTASTGLVGGSSSTIFPRTDFDVGNQPLAITAADFNNDGLKDLAVVNHNDNTLTILQNEGSGNFTQPSISPIKLGTDETGPSAIASAVFRTGASTQDLVIANTTSNTVSVLLETQNSDGTYSFSEATGSPFTVGNQPSAIAVADFNGDGNLDFAVANRGDNSISVFFGDGNGGFTAGSASPFVLPSGQTGPIALVVGDFRNQGKPDLAVVNQATNNVSILLSSGDSSFKGAFTEATNSPITVGTSPVAIAAADLDQDGIPDLAVVNQTDNTVTLLHSNGDGTFSTITGSPLSTGATPTGIAIADFTNDTIPDLVVSNEGVSTIGVYVGEGSGAFSSRLELSTASGPFSVLATDLNGDGLPDVAVTEQSSSSSVGQVSVFLDSSSFANGSNSTVPYPGSEYVDLGVKVKVTPTIHANDEVTLQLEFEIRSLAGSSINGIPVITNRTLSQTVRVKEDETTLIGGLLDDEETRAISGLPGFASLPGAGYAFGTNDTSHKDTELLILVTPHKLRAPDRSSKAIYAGRGSSTGRGAAGGSALPPQPLPTAPEQNPPPGSAPPSQPPPGGPQQNQPPQPPPQPQP